jgi:hypothetical protein
MSNLIVGEPKGYKVVFTRGGTVMDPQPDTTNYKFDWAESDASVEMSLNGALDTLTATKDGASTLSCVVTLPGGATLNPSTDLTAELPVPDGANIVEA